MTDVLHAEVPCEEPVPTDSAPRWPAEIAWFTAPFLPATTARRTAHVTLKRAYVNHVAASLLPVTSYVLTTASAFAGAAMTDRVILVVSILLLIEGVTLLCAFLAAPWGAQDEPIRSSMTNALRRIWLHTPHLFLVTWFILTATTHLYRARGKAYRSVVEQQRSIYILPYKNVAAPPPAYYAAVEKAWLEQPWFFRYVEEIQFCMIDAAIVWWLWAFLRAVGVRRRIQPPSRPPMCGECGYILTGLSPEGRCPECGEPIARSTGPDARPGSPWQHRRELGRWKAWRRCSLDAIFRPRTFGRQLQFCPSEACHRGFLVVHLILAWAVFAGGFFPSLEAATWLEPRVRDFGIYRLEVIPFVVASAWCAGLGLVVALGVAAAVGTVQGVRVGRNLMAPAMQAASYLGLYLVVWTILFLLIVMGFLVVEARFFGSAPSPTPRFLVWVSFQLICLIVYVRLVARITAGAQYADRQTDPSSPEG